MDMIFLLILKSSLKASITALLIILIKKLFNNVISARLHYILWFLVLIRIFIPFLPESHLSIFNIFESKSVEVHIEKNSSFQINSSINNELSQEELYENQLIDTYDDNNLVKQNNNIEMTFLKILSLIWFIGFLFMLFLVFQSMIRIKLKTKYFSKVTNTNILLVANKCKEKLNINKEITIYTGDYFKSPCILGIINPYMYYPANMLTNTNDDMLYHILLHELAHYKRKDHLSNLLKVLALSIHWFNPIIWICIKRMHRDIELACDAYVLEVIGEKEALSYGNTIIECLKHLSLVKLQPNVLFFYESNNQFERRIRMIKGFKKGSYKLSIAAVIFFTIIGAIMVTNGVTTAAGIPENNKKFSTQNDSTPITEPIYKDKLVVLDPGHGDHDPGAINSELNLKEKEVVLDISLRLKELLESTGFKVYMTREDDTYIGLHERADAANKLKADAYISIHVGAHMNDDIEGIVSLYSSVDDRDNKTFATIVKNSVVKELNTSDKGIVEQNNFISLKETKMPAISLELGFLTNPKEGKLMQENGYRQSCAEGIHKGIIEYFNKSNEGNQNKKTLASTTNTEKLSMNSYDELDKLPQKYTSELAKKNDDVVGIHGESYNIEKLDKFIQDFENEEAVVGNMVRITTYTIEGDAIIHDLIISEEDIKLIRDNTRDEFSSVEDRKKTQYNVVDIFKKNENEGIVYIAKTDKGEELYLIFANNK